MPMPSWPDTPPSPLWQRLSRESFTAPKLTEATRADAVVVGGGITGLSTALSLRERGLSVILLEAVTIGAGASGRANGQVIGTLTRMPPDQIREKIGQPFLDLVAGSADRLFALVERFNIDCDARRSGWLQPAHSAGRAKRAAGLAAGWARAGADTQALSREEVTDLIGAPGYQGGWLHRGGGHINPYAFTLGLARGVAGEGVQIFEHSPALRLDREGEGWRVTTPEGEVRARYVVLATAAHTGDLWPGLAQSLVPVTSYQTATAPLGALADQILPGDQAFSDTRQDLRYMRKDREGRLVSGAALAVQIGAKFRLPRAVRRRLGELFPALSKAQMPEFWGGRIGMTTDRLPHLHRTDDGLAAFVGCNGRGLGLCCAMGPLLADAVTGVAEAELALKPQPIRRLPMHFFVKRFARMILPWLRWQDSREVK